ncbi:hypothetical protein [uncultured Brachyspira sp.]|uniref:hypothetical protein n=1 Tax=uncultured Brachyspira sp. TaxID=221953 RepID=UPI0026029DE7|nr:hypothetical protein [uncultured Brachyspira sp.]
MHILYSMNISPEFGIFMNIGASKIFTKTEVDQNEYSYLVDFKTIKGDIFLDFEAIFQIGVKNNINNNIVTGLTSLLEIGYSPYIINTQYQGESNGDTYIFTDRVNLHSFILGIIEKIVFNKFSIGIGAGVLFPISGFGISNNFEYDNNALVIPSKNKLNHYDIKNLFIIPIAPYIKITAEYAFKPYRIDNAEMNFVLGVYLNYNFGMQYDVSVLNKYTPQETIPPTIGIFESDIYYKYDYSNLDFGITLGVSFRALE